MPATLWDWRGKPTKSRSAINLLKILILCVDLPLCTLDFSKIYLTTLKSPPIHQAFWQRPERSTNSCENSLMPKGGREHYTPIRPPSRQSQEKLIETEKDPTAVAVTEILSSFHIIRMPPTAPSTSRKTQIIWWELLSAFHPPVNF